MDGRAVSEIYYKQTVRRMLFSALLLAGMLAGVPALAQDINSRLSRIENEIQTLSRAVFRGETPPPGSRALGGDISSVQSANIEVRLQQIEIEIRNLTGRLEEVDYENQRARQRLEESYKALERRLAAMEMRNGSQAAPEGEPYSRDSMAGPGAGSPSGGSVYGYQNGQPQGMPSYDMLAPRPDYDYESPAPSSAPSAGQLGVLRQPPEGSLPAGEGYAEPAAPAISDPAELYERAFSYLRDRNYGAAETGFTDFLSRYPGHDLAPNAKYWLGETYYVRNNFERAARIFAEAYQQYPKGPKGADNLLKLGMSLAGLGKTEDACIAFSQLQKEYPSGAVPVLMRAEKEMEKLGCEQF